MCDDHFFLNDHFHFMRDDHFFDNLFRLAGRQQDADRGKQGD